MNASKSVRILNVHPVHPGRGETSFIQATVGLSYLKGEPLARVVLSAAEAVLLIEQLAQAVRATTMRNQ